MITGFLLALQFLTVIPLKIKDVTEKKIADSVIYFPVVGLLLGLALAGTAELLFRFTFTALSINVILVILLVCLTGGIHLDGLADSTDAFLSRKNRELMLGIMRDAHIGVMGVLGIISTILLKISFLYSIAMSLKLVSLVLACVLSRWAMVMAMFFFPYARQEGKAKIYIQGMNLKLFILATIFVLLCVFGAWQIKGLIVFAATAVFAYIFNNLVFRKIGGITGDTLGALNEITEVFILLMICCLGRAN
jgi:adenosylcobinamide-GDP ribazoletransferase